MSVFPSLAFLTGSVGTGEWIVLFVVVLIVVGPKRLPDIARKLGRTMEMFRRAADEFKEQILTMDQEPPAPTPTPPPTADADGVAQPDGSDAYSDAYPNMSDYPGNEGQVENWHSDALSESQGSEGGGAAAEASVGQGEGAEGAPAAPDPSSAPEKPAEGGP